MSAQQIFALQFGMNLLVYSLAAAWYLTPWRARLTLERALPPLLLLHATRHLGLVFLVPTVVEAPLPGRALSRPGARRSAECAR
jgi:hypothetical protein